MRDARVGPGDAAHASPPAAPGSTALAWQLAVAARVCAAVRDGRSLRDALATWRAKLPGGGHAAVQDIGFRTMRRRGTADALLARLADRAPVGAIRELLVIALALASEPAPPYDDYVLVDQAVEAVAALPQGAAKKAFVNALLRRYLRERAALDTAVSSDPVAHWNYPSWWIDAVRRDHPANWQTILRAGNAQAPMTLRVNARRSDPSALRERWAAAGLAARTCARAPYALYLDRPRPIEALPGFAEGVVSVQDAGAQIAAPLLAAEAGMRVLDACAAPGGKSAHLLELSDCDLLAIDIDADRIPRIAENLARLGLNARLAAADAAAPQTWWNGQPFDRILADVPCTASGIVRRHPDVRWLRRPGDRDQLATTAARILDALWRTLAPDGTIVLASCSIFEHEGERQLSRFLDRHPDAVRLSAPGQLLPSVAPAAPSLPECNDLDHDGFYYARIAKRH